MNRILVSLLFSLQKVVVEKTTILIIIGEELSSPE